MAASTPVSLTSSASAARDIAVRAGIGGVGGDADSGDAASAAARSTRPLPCAPCCAGERKARRGAGPRPLRCSHAKARKAALRYSAMHAARRLRKVGSNDAAKSSERGSRGALGRPRSCQCNARTSLHRRSTVQHASPSFTRSSYSAYRSDSIALALTDTPTTSTRSAAEPPADTESPGPI
eukprot:4777205-Pleurochrysis_carterae.AAC.1